MNSQTISMHVWQGKRQQPKRKLMPVIFKLFCLLIGVFTAIAIILYGQIKFSSNDFTLLPIEHIEIKEELSNLRAKEVFAIVDQYKYENFFLANVSEMQNALAQLSWVKSTAVNRIWPNQLDVTVIEEQPVAIWQNQHVNIIGKIFDQDNKALNLPVFNLPKQHIELALNFYKKMQTKFWELQLSINIIEMDERASMTLTLDNDAQIILGTQRWYEKTNNLLTIFKDNQFNNQVIDLRYENGFAITNPKQKIAMSEGN